MSSRHSIAAALLLALAESLRAGDAAAGLDWPQFRGRGAAGIAEGANPPSAWDVEKGTNVRWRTPIPGLAHASPVVAGGRVFIVTAVSEKADPQLRIGLYGDVAPVQDESRHSWRLFALDRGTGKVLWEKTVREGVPRTKRHTKSSHANSTPATDGERLVVFLGSEGLLCLDLEGKLLWEKDLGVLDAGFFRMPAAQWAFGSSPVIHGDMAIVQCDVQRDSFIAAFRLKDGSEAWRTPRDDVPTWSTPAVVEVGTPGGTGSRALVIANGYRHAGGYDALTGKEVWRLSGGGDIPVPTPVAAHGLVFLSSAHGPQAPLVAVKLGAAGDVSLAAGATANEHVAWARPRDGIYMQTPIVVGDQLYACRDNGVLACYAARTGEPAYRQRLGDGRTGFTASPVAAAGRLYFTSEEGDVHVVKAGPEFQLLGVNRIGEVCLATPAISGELFIARARSHVYAFADRREE